MIKRGMFFTVDSPSYVGRIVKYLEKLQSFDAAATATHAGIIIDRIGTTFEALERYTNGNIFNDYSDIKICIARHRYLYIEKFNEIYPIVERKFKGRTYPFARIAILGLFPRLSKWLYMGKPTCAELVFYLLKECDLIGYFKGVTPDYLDDAFHKWNDFEIVFEGKLTNKEKPGIFKL